MKITTISILLLLTSTVLFGQTKHKVTSKAKFSIIGCWSATKVGDGSEIHFYPDMHFSVISPNKSERGLYEYIKDVVILHFEDGYGKVVKDETL